jgi:hypothetical protein
MESVGRRFALSLEGYRRRQRRQAWASTQNEPRAATGDRPTTSGPHSLVVKIKRSAQLPAIPLQVSPDRRFGIVQDQHGEPMSGVFGSPRAQVISLLGRQPQKRRLATNWHPLAYLIGFAERRFHAVGARSSKTSRDPSR